MSRYLLIFFIGGLLALAAVPVALGVFKDGGVLANVAGAQSPATCEEDWDDIGDDEDDPGEVDDADCDANGQPIRDDDDDDADDAGDSPDVPLTGSDYDRATQAALAATGGGTVTDTEADDDDGGAYEVEIRLPNGREVEVHLDANFRVISQEDDD
jgi:uncharacterized membrane protein YkoI